MTDSPDDNVIPLRRATSSNPAGQPRDIAVEHPSAEDALWFENGLLLIARRAKSLRPFQAADLTSDGLGEPRHPNHWGILFQRAHRAELIVSIGAAVSGRASRAGGITRVWRGTDQLPKAAGADE